jgi:Putative phage tail protein
VGRMAFSIGGMVAGGIIGSFLGAPQIGASLGGMVGGVMGGLTGSDGGSNRLDDLRVTSSAYGMPIGKSYGTVRVGGNVIWSPGLQGKRTNAMGKGALSGPKTYNYTCSFAIAFGRGVAQNVVTIWADSRIIYSQNNTFRVDQYGNNTYNTPYDTPFDPTSDTPTTVTTKTKVNKGVGGTTKTGVRFRFYGGTDTQMPDPLIVAHEGEGNVSAHRGLCYMVFEDLPLADFGNRIPQISIEVTFAEQSQYPYLGFLPSGGMTGPSAVGIWQGAAVAIDWNRGVYISETASGLTVTDIASMTRITARDWATVYGSSDSGLNAVAVAPDGFIYACPFGSSDGAPIYKIDPFSLLTVKKFGAENPGLSGISYSKTNAVNTAGIGVFTSGSLTYLVLNSILGGFAVLETGQMQMVWWDGMNGGAPVLGVGLTTPGLIGCYQITDGVAYVVAHDSLQMWTGGTLPIKIAMLIGPQQMAFDSAGNPTAFNLESLSTIYATDIANACQDALAAGMDRFGQPVNTSAYDPSDLGIIFVATLRNSSTGATMNVAFKWRRNTGIVWAVANAPTMPPGLRQARLTGDKLTWFGGATQFDFDLQSGALTQKSWPANSNNTAGAIQIHDATTDTVIILGGSAPDQSDGRNTADRMMVINRGSGGPGYLDAIVTDLVTSTGQLTPADIDVSDLSGQTVPGYVVGRPSNARDALQPLAQGYLFDVVESDGKLKFVTRGQSSVRTINQWELVPRQTGQGETGPGEYFTDKLSQDFDVPAIIHVSYTDPGNQFESGSAMARRLLGPVPAVKSTSNLHLQLPIVLDSSYVSQLANKMLYSAWQERHKYQFDVGWTHIDLDPTDVVTVTLDNGTSFEARIEKADFGVDMALAIEGVSQRQTTYAADTNVGSAQPNTLLYGFDTATATRLIVFDLPLLRDTDDLAGAGSCVYAAACGIKPTASWPGCDVYYSVDAINFTKVASIVNPCTWGNCLTALPDAPFGFSWDTTTQLNISLQADYDVLSSISDDQVLTAFNNAFAVQNGSGAWEIIQAANVVQNADGTFTLSRLLRGRRGTDANAVGHQAGGLIVYLSSAELAKFELQISDLNVTRYYRGVTAGTDLASATTVSAVNTGADLKPYAPVDVAVQETGTSPNFDITLAWQRRTRMGGEMQSWTGTVPLSEVSEAYDVEILSGPGGIVLRTLSCTTPSTVYANADVVTDFGAIPTTLTLRVYQKSAVIGRGYTHEVTVGVN